MIKSVLESASDSTLAQEIVESYSEIQENFISKKWKTAELDAGHFVESVRRFIDYKLFGAYSAIGQNLPRFNEVELKRYENVSGDDSYRVLIPRALYTAYAIRNKRGVGHLGLVKSNQMDATLIFQIVKWVLAELIRLNSALNINEAEMLIERITNRQIDIIWKHDGVTRILNTKLRIDKKVLVLLYDTNSQTIEQHKSNTKYKNKTEFNKTIKKLDEKLFIEVKQDGTCLITPLGESEAEKIIIGLGSKI